MIEGSFVQILNMSITAGIMVLAVLLLRLLLKKMPKIYSYVLWLVVLFRLLCPVSFGTEYSLMGMLNTGTVKQGQVAYISADEDLWLDEADNEMRADDGEIEEKSTLSEQLLLQIGEEKMFSHKLFLKIASRVWLLGIILITGGSLRELFLLRKRLKEAVWQKDNVYFCKEIQTPFMIGVLKPRIILPFTIKEEEMDYIILHEQIHIKRKDHIIRMVSFLCVCIHWFNPLIWLAFFLSGKDMEMSCDEAVVRRIGNSVKKEYSMSLLSLASGERIVGGAPVLFGEGDTKSRIKNVLNFKRPKKIAGVVAVILCAIAGVFLLGNPSEETEVVGGVEAEKEESIPQTEEEEILLDKEMYFVNVQSISRSARCIDRYRIPDEQDIKELGMEYTYNEETGMLEETLAFSEACVFKTNFSMNTVEYEEISFDNFADWIGEGDANLSKPCLVVMEEGLITEIILKSAYYNFGIDFSKKTKDNSYLDMVEIVKEVDGEDTNMMDTYYDLVYSSLSDSSKKWDVVEHSTHEERISSTMNITQESPEEWRENNWSSIEVYTGNIGDGESGYVFVKNADGEILHSEFAHAARAGWNNVYLGSIEGTDYLMTVHIEDRDDFGGYNYEVFRVDENGEILQIAGSHFAWGGAYIYDDTLFKEWVASLEYYLENSHLILSTQGGEVHTEAKPEEVYNYETLRKK